METTRSFQGHVFERFTGHVSRISGVQWLHKLGVPLQMLQVLGRWASLTILKYLQAAPLQIVPEVVATALARGPTDSADQIIGSVCLRYQRRQARVRDRLPGRKLLSPTVRPEDQRVMGPRAAQPRASRAGQASTAVAMSTGGWTLARTRPRAVRTWRTSRERWS